MSILFDSIDLWANEKLLVICFIPIDRLNKLAEMFVYFWDAFWLVRIVQCHQSSIINSIINCYCNIRSIFYFQSGARTDGYAMVILEACRPNSRTTEHFMLLHHYPVCTRDLSCAILANFVLFNCCRTLALALFFPSWMHPSYVSSLSLSHCRSLPLSLSRRTRSSLVA